MPARKKPARFATRTPSRPYFVSVAVVVSDAAASLQWYTAALGLEEMLNEGHLVTVGTTGKSAQLHLCELSRNDPDAKLEPGNSGILLFVPGSDFEGTCDAMKARGVEFAEEPTKADWGTYAVVRDPDGNELTLMPEP